MTELQFDKEDKIMRNCLRCGVEMVEDLTVSGEVDPAGLRVTRGGVFKDPLGRLKAAVCPRCGCAELYLDRLDKLLDRG